jgi:predicted HicB family RNase H-like nuclease
MKDINERLTIWIDPQVKRQAKAKAAANDVSLSAVIEDLLARYLKSMKNGVGRRVNE